MSAVAVLGSTGYLGSRFVRVLEKRGFEAAGLSREQLDYTRVEALVPFLRSVRPIFLINAAGFTGKPNVDACETQKTECLFSNSVLPGRVRESCEQTGVPWGHVSSGCIYSGERPGGGGWKETDEPNFSFRSPPCSFYSGTKALGEEVLEGAEDCYVWRLRIPFNEDANPRNYLQKLLNYENLLEAENSISHLGEFVDLCLKCFEHEIEPGVYNMTNKGSITTKQVTSWMLEEGVTDKDFSFFQDETDFMDRAALTPRSNCVLDATKAEQAGVGMRPVEEAVRDSLRKMKQGGLV
mgnify:CR=1 FL=1